MGRGGGGRRGHRNAHSDDREVQISKALSSVLRHRAKELGLGMDERGFVKVDELLAHNRFRSLHLTLPELSSIVASNSKQRFELSLLPPTPDSTPASSSLDNPANYLIRATQGHSIKGLNPEALLSPVLPDDTDFPAEVVHGTYPAAWKAILESGGLKPMSRTHVHFAVGLPDGKVKVPNATPPPTGAGGVQEGNGDVSAPVSTIGTAINSNDAEGTSTTPTADAEPVISGMRTSASLLIWVDVKRAIEHGGVKWWRSRNGVILTEGIVKEGEKEGLLSVEYVSRVMQRKTGNVVWKSEWWEPDDGQGGGS